MRHAAQQVARAEGADGHRERERAQDQALLVGARVADPVDPHRGTR